VPLSGLSRSAHHFWTDPVHAVGKQSINGTCKLGILATIEYSDCIQPELGTVQYLLDDRQRLPVERL